MDTIEKASDYAQEAAETIAHTATRAAKTFGEKGEQLLDAEQKMIKQLSSFVSYHPIASVGIAIAVGYILDDLLSEH
jgi:ElaB/YqjD/DUF883 family membrane-anchored ribosome-binding protein